jgi:ATP-dependent DNA helicase RecQ
MFGAAHLVDVLTGKHTDKVHQHSHSQLSVFGIGTEKAAQAWRSVIRQMVVQGFLRADAERFGALVLTERSRAVLRGEDSVRLREDPKSAPRSRRKAAVEQEIAITDITLWQTLRDTRQRLASEHNVPPYVIFHDSTLKQMLTDRPTSADQLLEISGVGQAKLARYGEEFLEVLRAEERA